MNGINPNDAVHVLPWKRLYEAAMLELEPTKTIERIAEARSAIVARINDRISHPSNREKLALRNALESLTVLRTIAERKMRQQQNTGT